MRCVNNTELGAPEVSSIQSLRSQRRETARTTPRLSTASEQAIADARSAYIYAELTVGRDGENDLVCPRPTLLFHLSTLSWRLWPLCSVYERTEVVALNWCVYTASNSLKAYLNTHLRVEIITLLGYIS